jgi:hypothetical protein
MQKITATTLDNVFASPLIDKETAELRGYECIEELFCDSSGFGQECEPALTVNAFERRTRELINEHGTLYTGITGQGMFQVYVGFFKKTGKAIAKKVAHATYKIETATGYKIRYHATDVIEYSNSDIILRNGGYLTKTTKERINEYLPQGMYMSQKNYMWTVHDTRTQQSVPFKDGMTIIGGTIIPY